MRETGVHAISARLLLALSLLAALLLPGALQAGNAAEGAGSGMGQFVWKYSPEREDVVDRLRAMAPASRQRICSLLPSCGTETIEVRVSESEEEFLATQPMSVHIDWAAGVAWPDQNLIVLRVDKSMLLTLEETFEHELSHLLLYQAVAPPIPRWFVEGLAIIQSERNLIQRFEAVAGASVADSLYALEEISDRFPGSHGGRGIAYAQSGMFVSWLLGAIGEPAFKKMIALMAKGSTINGAVLASAGVSLEELEEQWRSTLGRGAWLKGLSESWGLWTIMGLLVVVGVFLRRRRNKLIKRGYRGDDGPDWEYRHGQ